MIIPQDVVDRIEKEIKASHDKQRVEYMTHSDIAHEEGRRKALFQAREWVWQINAITDERLKG